MFRASDGDASQNPHFQKFLALVPREFWETESNLADLDFATIEQRAHEAGQKVARLLCEKAASQQARSADQPQPCPDCGRLCTGSIVTRELITRDGPIQLEEARYECPHCRRAFFPQPTDATLESSLLQSGRHDDRGHHGDCGSLVRGSLQAADHRRRGEGLTPAPSDPLPRGRRRTRR